MPSNSVLIILYLVGSVSIHVYWGFYCVPGNKAELCPQKAQSHRVLVYTQGRNSQKHLTHSCQTLEGRKIIWKACYKTGFWASTYILGFFFFIYIYIYPWFLIHRVYSGAWEFAFLTSFRLMLILLAPGSTLWEPWRKCCTPSEMVLNTCMLWFFKGQRL